jgi:hypothetical protein
MYSLQLQKCYCITSLRKIQGPSLNKYINEETIFTREGDQQCTENYLQASNLGQRLRKRVTPSFEEKSYSLNLKDQIKYFSKEMNQDLRLGRPLSKV